MKRIIKASEQPEQIDELFIDISNNMKNLSDDCYHLSRVLQNTHNSGPATALNEIAQEILSLKSRLAKVYGITNLE